MGRRRRRTASRVFFRSKSRSANCDTGQKRKLRGWDMCTQALEGMRGERYSLLSHHPNFNGVYGVYINLSHKFHAGYLAQWQRVWLRSLTAPKGCRFESCGGHFSCGFGLPFSFFILFLFEPLHVPASFKPTRITLRPSCQTA
jgi:hypothetical protein